MPNLIKCFQMLLAMLVLLAAAVLICSCCSDCPTGPGDSMPYKGWLYATNTQNNWVYMIDTEADSLVDSVNSGIDPSYTPGPIDVSQDGRFLAVPFYSIPLNAGFVRIYDAQTLEIITDIADYFFPVFITSENILLAVRNGIRIYDLSDFSVQSSDSIGPSLFPVLCEKQHLVYVLSMVGYDNTDSTFLYAYDYKQMKKVSQWFFHDSMGDLAAVGPFDINSDGDRIYAVGGSDNVYDFFACYDLLTGNQIFFNRLFSANGNVKLSPDEKEIYVTDPGLSFDVRAPGTVYVYNASNGDYIEGVSLYGYDISPIQSLCATPIAFTPTGEKVYIGSGRPNISPGTISVIDTRTHDIKKNIWPNLGHFIGTLKIGPKL